MSRSLASRVARARRARGGFTLVELLVATVAGLIVATSVIALSRDATTTFQEEIRASAAESSLRLAAERLRADIQRAGYMGTPNAYNDPAIERGTNQYGTVYDATHPGIKNMVGLTLTNGGSTDATYTNAATVASYSGFNALNPDTVTVSGNMTTSDQYLGNYMAGQGGCGVARFQFSNDDPADLPLCEIDGSCTFDFTDSRGRKGPVTVNLPPGYGHKEEQDRRYPVIYLLHGYGQTPEDLKAAIVFLSNWMNYAGDSSATRLTKAIMVYVDGRCRVGPNGPECIRGTFYTDSVRADGPKMEQWFLELMDWVDTKSGFRVMGPSDIEWTE